MGNVYRSSLASSGSKATCNPSRTSSSPPWTWTKWDAHNGQHPRRSSTSFLRSPLARSCSKFGFVYTKRSYGYLNGRLNPSAGAVAEPRGPWLQGPGCILHILEWQDDFDGDMPQGWTPAPPPPHGSPRVPRNRGQAATSATGQNTQDGGHPGTGGAQQFEPSFRICKNFDHGLALQRQAHGPRWPDGRLPQMLPASLPMAQRKPRFQGPHPRGAPGRSRAYAGGPGEAPAPQRGAAHAGAAQGIPVHARKYLSMCYVPREQAPMPTPDKDCIVYNVTAKGEDIYSRCCPRTRWPRPDGCEEVS